MNTASGCTGSSDRAVMHRHFLLSGSFSAFLTKLLFIFSSGLAASSAMAAADIIIEPPVDDDVTIIKRVALAPTPRTTSYVLNSSGISHLDWPFLLTKSGSANGGWYTASGSNCHYGDDYYAQDWNFGSYTDDYGRSVFSVGRGVVFYAGTSSAWGNQVIVRLNGASGFYIRFAHLASIAVSRGNPVYFGSELGTVGATGAVSAVHLHAVLYKNIVSGSQAQTNLQQGRSPSGKTMCDSGDPASTYAAQFELNGIPFSYHPREEDLPCNVWNNDVANCDAHSILFGGQYTQDCAFYSQSGICAPRGTSNSRAHIGAHDPTGGDAYEYLPCSTWNSNEGACNAHALQPGGTRDCAYYVTTQKCRPRGTSNCLAGISGYCNQ